MQLSHHKEREFLSRSLPLRLWLFFHGREGGARDEWRDSTDFGFLSFVDVHGRQNDCIGPRRIPNVCDTKHHCEKRDRNSVSSRKTHDRGRISGKHPVLI